MSQHNSSILSSGIQNGMHNSSMQGNLQSAEVKYQKALKEISKIMGINKNLKLQCQQRQQILATQLSQVAMRFEQLSKKHQQLEQQKTQMQQFIDELQDTNQDLRKQYQTMERQVGYMNDVLTEQNGELKKLSSFKDERGISQLFRSYEDKENSYKKEISLLEEHITNLKATVDRIEGDLAQETEMRQRYEDQYNIVGLEISKYRDLNNYLMNQNESILNGEREDRYQGKQKELESFVLEFKRQLQSLRNVRYDAEDISKKQYIKNYELLLQEKNSLAIQLAKTKDHLDITQNQLKELFDAEEKMQTTTAKIQLIVEENNMLKNRITLLESKDLVEGGGLEEDFDLKDFEERINFMIAKSDPLAKIKNSDDNANFLTMKSFISNLQAKLSSITEQKLTIQKKYKSLKSKFSQVAQQKIKYQDSNKLLKGKLQGYERLTEKLHFQLQRSMHAHEDQIVKMVAITNNLVSKKVEQSKTTSGFMKGQFQIELQKSQKQIKTLSQQLQTTKLENGSQRIRLTDLEQKVKQSEQFMHIYQTKLTQLTNRYKELQNENTQLNDKLLKFEQLYRQEKTKHETLLIQKQNLSNRISVISQELNQRTYKWQEEQRMKEENYQIQIRRTHLDLQRLKEENDILKGDNKRISSELQERISIETRTLSNVRSENNFYTELEKSYNQAKQANYLLESQLISYKQKLLNFDSIQNQLTQIESALMRKTDELNDEKRNSILLKKQIQELNMVYNDLRLHDQNVSKQLAALSNKLYQESMNPRDSLHSKDTQNRRNIQKLNEEIAILESQLRDQKNKSARFIAQVQTLKDEIQRLQEVNLKSKSRQQNLLSTISQTQQQVSKIQDQLFQYKSKLTYHTSNLQNSNQILDQSNLRINQLTEQIASTKGKLTKSQSKFSTIIRDLSSVKYNIKEAQKMVNRLNTVDKLQWDQQREKDNISALIEALNRILINSENLILSNSGSLEYSFVPTSSFGNLQGQVSTYRNNSNFYVGASFGSDDLSKGNPVTNASFTYQEYSTNQPTSQVNYSSDSIRNDFNGSPFFGSADRFQSHL